MQNEMIQILLIEDDPAEAGLIREMLAQQRRQEYSVEHVQYLADALALLEKRIFDCILVDLGLPDSQGLETALAVRNQAKLTPVAIITILDSEDLALKALEMDIQDYLVKGEINGPLLARSISYAMQRKHVEDALRFSEARYRSLFRSNPVMIVTLDAGWKMLSVNPACANRLGYTIDELEGQSVLKLFHPDDRPAVAEQLRRCMEHPDQVFNWQFRKMRKDGEMLWVEETAQAAPDLNGSLNLLVACQDITERKRAEEALIWAKEEWERTFDSVPDLIAILDDQNRIMRVNRAMAERLGRQPEECAGLLCYQAIHEAENPPADCPHARTAEDGRRHDAEAYVARLGGEFLVSTSPLLGPDGIMRGVVHVARDITERKRVEEELKNSEEKLRFASTAADIGTWHWDLAKDELTWSERCKTLFGYPPDYPMTYEAFLRPVHEEDRQGIQEAVHKALQEKSEYLVEMRVVLPDGQTRWVMSKGRAYYDEQGKPVRMHGIAMDITERKQVQEALRFSEERYRALFRDNPVMIVTLDVDWTMLSVNPTCAGQLGYSLDELEGQSALMLFHEDDRPAVAEQLRMCLQNPEQVYRWQFRKIRKDRTLLWVEETAQAVYELNGALNVLVVCQDITERKQAEAEIKWLASFPLMNPNPVMELDTNGQMTFCNPAAKQLMEQAGYSGGINPLTPQDMPAILQDLKDEKAGQLSREIEIDGRFFEAVIYLVPQSRTVRIYTIEITARKRAEEALRESETHYRTLFDSIDEGFCIIEMIFDENNKPLDYRFLETNPSFEKHTGLIDALGRRMRELVPKHEEHWFEIYGRVALTGEPARFQNRAEQLQRWYDVYAFPFGQAENRQVAIVFNDITERKRAEEALRESEQRFASFMLHLPAAAWMKDLHGKYVYVNAEAEHVFSTPLSALLDKTDDEVFPPETARQFRENDELVLANGGSLQTTEVLRQADGIKHHSIVSKFAVPGPDGQPAYVAGVALDVTDRKLAEEALRKSELKLSKIFHTVPALICITTVDEGRCNDINETGLRTLGYRREEVVGRTMLELGVWENKSARDRVIRALEENGMVRDLEINFRGRDGRIFTGLFSAELVDFNGNRYMLSIVNDITERKRMEEEIERLNTDLAARAFGLEVANRELEAFNYTVAHDLRKPLTVVNGYCQALGELCGDRLDEACRGYLRDAYDGTLRMNRLIDALLNFSQLAHVELRRESVDLSSLAHKVAAELQLSEPERRVTFRIAEGAVVNVDANLLRVVLDNLLGNAWKYTGMREEAVIEFGVTRFGGKTAFFVRDNGAGFAMADAEKLFVPFQRLPGAEGFKGFGIGLATVARIIERHGGRLWAEGEPDNGAIFYFTL